MHRLLKTALATWLMTTSLTALAQVKMSHEQMMFYTSEWKGERFPDGRPRVPAALLARAVDVSIEDVWEFLRDKGYNCQFDTGFQTLHPEKAFAGRALTAQYMPSRPDMARAIAAEAPIRIGRATVVPGDVVLAKKDGVIFIPAFLAEEAISNAEFTSLEDAFNFYLNSQGKNGGNFEGGWDARKYDALAAWVKANPGKLKMTQAQFDSIEAQRKAQGAH